MAPVTVLILAPAPAAAAGPLARLVADARAGLGDMLSAGFLRAGADEVLTGTPDGRPFGTVLRDLATSRPGRGLVVLGSGSIPLARPEDLVALVDAAAADAPGALANSSFSADVVAIARAADALRDLPGDLPNDNGLPRWLAEVAGIPVADLRDRRDLAVDVDSPLDLLLLEGLLAGLPVPAPADAAAVRERLASLRGLANDPAAELLVTGRTSAADLGRLERGSRARTRAVIEERGLRTATLAATRGRANRREPRSLLYELLLRDGPQRLGALVADMSDGALVDTRVLMAARHGADERGWPAAEDRFASDLLLPDRVRDLWLRELTESARGASVPVLLGAHTLVGPGAPLALGLGG